VMGLITSIDPLAYGIDGMRSALLGIAHFGPVIDASVLAGVALLFLSLGAYSFSRIEV
jgi:ABC-2 type transport system permease protein